MKKSVVRLGFVSTVMCIMCILLPVSVTLAGSKDTVKVGMRYDTSTVNMIEMRLAVDIPVVLLMHQSLIGPHPETGERIGLLAMLETGELDLVAAILPHQLKRLKRNKRFKIKHSDQVPSLFGIACFPNTDPLMADRNLGMALRYGINRKEIVEKIFLGQAYPLYTYASRAELGHDPSVAFEFDPQKAREYLKKSGYKKGTPLTFTYTSMVPNAPLIAALVQKYLQEIGITIKIQQLEEGTAAIYTRTRDKRIGHMRLYGWPGSRDPNLRLIMSILSTSDYASFTTRPRKEEVDKLILAQAREMDKTERKAIIGEIHKIMTYDSVGALLFGLNMIYGMSEHIDYTWTPKEAYFPNLHMIKMVN